MPYRVREVQRAYQREWMRRRRAEYLADKRCSFCNAETDLEIHHFDPAIKVSHAIWSWAKPRLEAELAKCVVLCHDCHVERHREERATHCSRGHELTEANTYVKPGTGRRECRECRRRHHQTFIAARRAA